MKLKQITDAAIVIAPILGALYGMSVGIPIFMNAETLTELFKGIIITGVSGIGGTILFFILGSAVYG